MRARFFDGLKAQAYDVALTIERGRVLIRSDDGVVARDWILARTSASTDPDGVVTLRLPDGPARLMVSDPEAQLELRPAVRRWSRRQIGWRLALLGCVAMVGFGFAMVNTLPGLLAPLVPSSWEDSLGAAAQAAMLGRHKRCDGADGQQALDGLISRLAAVGGITDPVTAVVVDDPLVNAFTLPGNRVLVMRGLIDLAGDGNELSGVVAHELGHVRHHDPMQGMLRQLGLGAIAFAFGVNGMGSAAYAQTLLGQSYGRAAETQADAFAITTLRGAGLRADGLGRFFARMEADGAPALRFLSDHPPTAERRARVRQPVDGAPAFDDAQWHAIRAMCARGISNER